MYRPTEKEFRRWLRRRTPLPDTPDGKGRDVSIFGWLLGLVVTPLLGLIVLVSIPLTSFMRAAERWRAERFARQMRETGRVAEWDYARSQRSAGKGTFIFANTAPKRAWRLWWAPERMVEVGPFPAPALNKQREALFKPEFAPFREWCYQSYLDVLSGKGFLVERTEKTAIIKLFEDDQCVKVFTVKSTRET